MTREFQWGRARELQNEVGGKRNQKFTENEKRPELWSKRGLSRSLAMWRDGNTYGISLCCC